MANERTVAAPAARIVLVDPLGEREFVFEKAEIVANSYSDVVVQFENERGERLRATLPKSMIRQVVSFRMLF
jgi:hypothetical protein